MTTTRNGLDYFYKHNPIPETSKKRFFQNKAKPETLELRRVTAQHESRRNMCPVCNIAMPKSGECC